MGDWDAAMTEQLKSHYSDDFNTWSLRAKCTWGEGMSSKATRNTLLCALPIAYPRLQNLSAQRIKCNQPLLMIFCLFSI